MAGIVASIRVVGGAALAIEYFERPATRDVDCLLSPADDIKAVAADLAHAHGWPEDWLNDKVVMCAPEGRDQTHIAALSSATGQTGQGQLWGVAVRVENSLTSRFVGSTLHTPVLTRAKGARRPHRQCDFFSLVARAPGGPSRPTRRRATSWGGQSASDAHKTSRPTGHQILPAIRRDGSPPADRRHCEQC
jgi:hypothetical protein